MKTRLRAINIRKEIHKSWDLQIIYDNVISWQENIYMISQWTADTIWSKRKRTEQSASTYLFIEETEGTLSWLQIPSASSLSLISHANMVGFSRL